MLSVYCSTFCYQPSAEGAVGETYKVLDLVELGGTKVCPTHGLYVAQDSYKYSPAHDPKAQTHQHVQDALHRLAPDFSHPTLFLLPTP